MLTIICYTFHHQLQTDGIAASVICIRKEYAGILKPKNPKFKYKEPYGHEISQGRRIQLQTMPNFVGVDPNKRDLAYAKMINKNDYNNAEQNNDPDAKMHAIKKGIEWRHTQDNRRFRTGTTKNRKRLQKEKKENYDITGFSIQQREAQLSRFCKKTLSFVSFKQYLFHKNKLNYFTGPFYREKKHRNRRFRAFGARQKLDSELINNFKETFGPPATTVVFWGDWSENKNRRFFEPIIGKGLRQVFRKAGYQVYLVREFKTSKMCSECQNDQAICNEFRYVKNPRPKSRQRFPTIMCHGLLRCRTCYRLWNRDSNAATNIWIAANAAVNGNERPQYLRNG